MVSLRRCGDEKHPPDRADHPGPLVGDQALRMRAVEQAVIEPGEREPCEQPRGGDPVPDAPRGHVLARDQSLGSDAAVSHQLHHRRDGRQAPQMLGGGRFPAARALEEIVRPQRDDGQQQDAAVRVPQRRVRRMDVRADQQRPSRVLDGDQHQDGVQRQQLAAQRHAAHRMTSRRRRDAGQQQQEHEAQTAGQLAGVNRPRLQRRVQQQDEGPPLSLADDGGGREGGRQQQQRAQQAVAEEPEDFLRRGAAQVHLRVGRPTEQHQRREEQGRDDDRCGRAPTAKRAQEFAPYDGMVPHVPHTAFQPPPSCTSGFPA